MIFNKKNLTTYALCLIFGLLIGSLLWEVLERVIHQFGSSFSLTTGQPLQLFDVYVLAVSIRANPGTFLGALGGTVFFKLI